ncbi:GNAT family N-acetyltransferase [Altererythrobacter xixiisoli]|uniref:GNAT family N-acetyltransferase n=1 Tax=Croceibacterium xixiisoli TaxID=1476466 RepID=A0A6I4TY61_9SPHN|nr:GNAT family N-acetyltransferase [Croceibacterium xixiisoli]MXP00935.1 GNAT family N-acetyltransferase [Croceibacterium xixiisoli]
MDRQPVLQGERVLLRPLRRSDWADLFAVASDREMWALHPSHDRWQEPVFRAFFKDALAQSGALAVVDLASGGVIGSSRFQGHVSGAGGDECAQPSQVEIGWTFLSRHYWGLGYNAEIKALMLEHALRFVDRAIFRVGADNVISRKAMLKIGGRLTGESTVEERVGRPVEHVVYEITRDSFAAGPLAIA